MARNDAASNRFWNRLEVLINLLSNKNDSIRHRDVIDNLLSYFLKDTHIVKFRSADGVQLPGADSEKGNVPLFDMFSEETGNLTNGNGFFGACSLFRIDAQDEYCAASFLTNLPQRMQFEINRSSKLELLSVEKATAETLVAQIHKPAPKRIVQHVFWKKLQQAYELLSEENLSDGQKHELDAIVEYLCLDAYLLTFEFAQGVIAPDLDVDPQKSDYLLNLFDEEVGLFAGNGYFGGCSVFHPHKTGSGWRISLLCNIPELMEHEIRENSRLVFIGSQKLTRDLLKAHLCERFG